MRLSRLISLAGVAIIAGSVVGGGVAMFAAPGSDAPAWAIGGVIAGVLITVIPEWTAKKW